MFSYKKVFVILFLLLNCCFPCFAESVKDGSVPRWITGTTNSLVNNMRALAAGKLSCWYDHAGGRAVAIKKGYTTCAYSCSIALRGTPYGADAEYMLDFSEPHPGDITIVGDEPGTFVAIARENNEWHEYGSYTPKPGDLVVNSSSMYEYAHVSMITESGGIIYNGSTSEGGIVEKDWTPETNYGASKIKGYIETSKYSNGAGILSNMVDWGLDMLATIGDGINDIVDQFSSLAATVMRTMSNVGTGLILTLIIIDFASYVCLNLDGSMRLSIMVGKLMKYAFLLWVFLNWEWLVDNLFLDFAQSTASAVSGGGNTSSNVTQPQFLLVKGVEAVAPCLNFISTAKGLTNIKNWPLLLLLVALSFITLGALMFSAIYVAFIFIEFYIVAAFNAIFMIFPVLRFTKFIGEGGLNTLIKSTIRLFITAILAYFLANMIGESTMLLDFPGDINALNDGTLRKYVFMCMYIWVFVYLIIRLPDKLSSFYNGGVNLPN